MRKMTLDSDLRLDYGGRIHKLGCWKLVLGLLAFARIER